MANQHVDRLLAEALPEGIVVLDAAGCLNWWNKTAGYLLNLASQQVGLSIDAVLDAPILSQLRLAPSLEVIAPHHLNIRLSLRLRPYEGEQQLLILQDVTTSHRLETMRQDFIANVSHELRTPLTVFQGYLELLKDSDLQDRDALMDIVAQMTGQAVRMQQLVEDLLLLARLESAEPDVESHQAVPVAALLEDIVQDAKSLSGDKQHQFVLALDDTVTLAGNREELRSAFSNLIYNAVHYTPSYGTITVRWYKDDSGKHMAVEDTGIGIAAKHIPKLTQRFYRVDKARSSKAGGTGLGLAIVKHVLLRHRGELHINSTPQKSTTFRCTFPTYGVSYGDSRH